MNPFRISTPTPSAHYETLYQQALKIDHSTFFQTLDHFFKHKPIHSFNDIIQDINKIARIGQVCIKRSDLMWLHGILLYRALVSYLRTHPEIEFVNIVETGTARGFSSLCMAKALYDEQRQGTIYTIDVLPHSVPIYWNCIRDESGKYTRAQLYENESCFHLFDYIQCIDCLLYTSPSPRD